jgi:hypothetical protein
VQEGFTRLWRGTSASIVLAVPTVSLSYLGILLYGFFSDPCVGDASYSLHLSYAILLKTILCN